MKNKEKFHDEIFEIACRGSRIAVSKKTGKPIACSGTSCDRCLLYSYSTDLYCKDCVEACKSWCEEEYEEPPIDWSKVPVDAPILVMDSENTSWHKRYFAKYEEGIVYAWSAGSTSWSSCDLDDVTSWKFAKLAENG